MAEAKKANQEKLTDRIFSSIPVTKIAYKGPKSADAKMSNELLKKRIFNDLFIIAIHQFYQKTAFLRKRPNMTPPTGRY